MEFSKIIGTPIITFYCVVYRYGDDVNDANYGTYYKFFANEENAIKFARSLFKIINGNCELVGEKLFDEANGNYICKNLIIKTTDITTTDYLTEYAVDSALDFLKNI